MASFFTKRSAALLLSLIAVCGSCSATAQTIVVGGTGMGLGLMRELGAAYAADHAGLLVKVLPSLGSSGGIRALRAGAVDMAISARPLKAKEAAEGATDFALAKTPFVLVSSHPEPMGIAREDLAPLFAAEAPRWSDGMPVNIILRQKNDSDNALLADLFPGMQAALAVARGRSFLPVARNDQENLQMAQNMKGSLTAASLLQVVAEAADVRLLPLDGVVPTLDALSDGSYPLSKTLYVILPAQPKPEAVAFLRYVRSVDARRVLWEAGAIRVD